MRHIFAQQPVAVLLKYLYLATDEWSIFWLNAVSSLAVGFVFSPVAGAWGCVDEVTGADVEGEDADSELVVVEVTVEELEEDDEDVN